MREEAGGRRWRDSEKEKGGRVSWRERGGRCARERDRGREKEKGRNHGGGRQHDAAEKVEEVDGIAT